MTKQATTKDKADKATEPCGKTKGNGGRRVFPPVSALKKKFPEAYRASGGVLVHTAPAMGCSFSYLEKLVANNEEFAQMRRSIDNEIDGLVQNRLLNIALGKETGHPTASIFWLKARAGWKDRQEVSHTGNIDFSESSIPEAAQPSKRPALALISGGAPAEPGADDD